MTTKLEKPLKREIALGDSRYVITLDPEGMNFTVKGRRKGIRLDWAELASGEAALATALNASANMQPTGAIRPPRHAGGRSHSRH